MPNRQTFEFRQDRVCVHEWDVYPSYSLLAGQPRKRFLQSFETVEAAKAAYPAAKGNSRWTEPTVSLNHLD